MYKFVFFIILSFCISSYTQKPDVQKDIRLIMQRQTDAWNNQDIEGFMQPYWHSDSLRFMGKSGVTLGWNATLARYKKNYQPSEMGQLQFTELFFNPINNDAVWVDGKWTLFRAQDTLSGHFSLLWKMIDHQWQIVADHSS
jgi:hypothetical protein